MAFGWGGRGTVKVKGADTVVPPNFSGLSDQSDHKVDGRPYPKAISIVSTPFSGSDTYGQGEPILLSVEFDQKVTAHVSAVVVLEMGSDLEGRQAGYSKGNGTDTLVFAYRVDPADHDSDGISVFVPENLNIKATGTEVEYQAKPGGESVTLDDDSDHKVDGSVIPSDTTAPTVTSVSFKVIPSVDEEDESSSSVTYELEDAIVVLVGFNEYVLVTGSPLIKIKIGDTYRDATYAWVTTADDESSDAVAIVEFSYRVQEGDVDTDGISIDANSLSLNGGTIRDDWENDATLTHAAVSDDSDHKVDAPDTTAPTVSSISITSDPGDDDTYGIGDTIEVTVTFSEDVTVTGAPQLELDFDGTAKTADYSSTDGAAVVFSYTVALNDSAPDGVGIEENKLTLNSGTIKDGSDNAATLTHNAVGRDDRHKVDGSDTTAPTVSSVAVTSDPGDDDTYGIGDAIEITVTFSEDVVVTGAPQLELDFEGTAKTASYSSTDGAAVVFSYIVALNDTDDDGIAIAASKLTLNGGSIQDGSDNDATLTHDAVAEDDGHKVDGTDEVAPTVSSVSITSDPGSDGTYITGETIEITVTFSEDVVVTGTPQITLNFYDTGSSDKQASYSSDDSSGADVVFTYTVAVGDSASDGLQIEANKLTLNGGTIKDVAENNAVLTHSAVAADAEHLVNGAGGV